jgi:glycosyltransferase involved in cell wall biosynthesis
MMTILIPSKNEPLICDIIRAAEKEFPDAQIVVSNERDGRGKGWNVRKALEYAKGDIVAIIDGDMDIHPRMIKRMLPFLDDYDVVVGKKQVRGLLSRRLLTILSRLYIWLMFGFNIDTQTGVKVYKRAALQNWHSDSFAYDIEVLHRARQRGFTIIEVPVDVCNSRGMKLKSVLRCLIESIRIRFSLW